MSKCLLEDPDCPTQEEEGMNGETPKLKKVRQQWQRGPLLLKQWLGPTVRVGRPARIPKPKGPPKAEWWDTTYHHLGDGGLQCGPVNTLRD